jgi:hypothetical protein
MEASLQLGQITQCPGLQATGTASPAFEYQLGCAADKFRGKLYDALTIKLETAFGAGQILTVLNWADDSRGYCSMKAIMTLIALSVSSGSISAQDGAELPRALQAKVEAASAACADFDNGEFIMEAGAIVRTDLDSDLKPDWVLNESAFACSSAASLFGSTGGTLSHFLIGDHLYSVLNQGWEARHLGSNRVLLIEVHGSQCDAYGYTPCVTASVWDAEAGLWRSAAANWEAP